MKKGIIFDFDGVICDSVNIKTQAFASMYKEFGDDVVTKVIDYHLEHGGISRYEKFRHYHKEFLGLSLSEEELEKMGKTFSDIAFQKVIDSPYLPGVLEFIQKSSTFASLFICTGTPETEINLILKEKGLRKYFTSVYGSPKTKTEIIKEIMNTYDFLPHQLEFYGDAMTDYHAAKNTSVKFFGVYSPETVFPVEVIVINNFLF
jgi:phosphoglycolate phosphatase-like HAD superfamily hydrolase